MHDILKKKKVFSRIGEPGKRLLAQWLLLLTTVAEDLGSGPSTNIRQLTTTYNSSSRGCSALQSPWGAALIWCAQPQTETHTHALKIFLKAGRWWHAPLISQYLGGRGRWVPMSLRPAWSTRASSRTSFKATEKPCLEKQNKTKKKKMEGDNNPHMHTMAHACPTQ